MENFLYGTPVQFYIVQDNKSFITNSATAESGITSAKCRRTRKCFRGNSFSSQEKQLFHYVDVYQRKHPKQTLC